MTRALGGIQAGIGTVQSALLTEAQFQDQFGTVWILADGRTVLGSRYNVLTGHTFAPDLRGVVLRGQDGGVGRNPDGSTALGTYQLDSLQGHYQGTTEIPHHHDTTFGALPLLYLAPGSGGLSGGSTVTSAAPATGNASTGLSVTGPTTDGVHGVPRISTESRMQNVTVNHFIKIN